MVESPLELIGQKEQELRARLLAARAQASRLVAEVREAAAAWLANEEAAAAAEAATWLRAQIRQHQLEVEEARAALDARVEAQPERIDAAAQLVEQAVLRLSPETVRSSNGPGEEVGGQEH